MQTFDALIAQSSVIWSVSKSAIAWLQDKLTILKALEDPSVKALDLKERNLGSPPVVLDVILYQ